MCGIAGYKWNGPGSDESLAGRMMKRLRHRGPDGDGLFTEPGDGVLLGHRRLSIIDLSERGRQPMTGEDGRVRMVCNGEIYNYRELRVELEGKGHRFYSDSDSETILHGYEEWGCACFSRLNGIFAIAIWDGGRKELVLARDPLGVKPLLYLRTARGYYFASEVKSFLELPNAEWLPAFDEDSLGELLTFQFLTNPSSCLLQGVKKVRPGHYAVIRDGALAERAYWSLEVDSVVASLPFHEAEAVCDAHLRRSVAMQMRADVPVGVLLSGGLDSSLVAAVAARTTPQPVHTFTAGFAHRWDERPQAAETARHIGSVHEEIMIDPGVINARIEELVYYFDDLSSLDGGLFTTYLLAEQIRERGVKVLLVGEGADEAFAGYSWYGLSTLPYRLMPASVRSALLTYTLSRLLPTSVARRRMTARVHAILNGSGERDICRQLQRFDLLHELPSHFLMKVDHGTMAHGIEARVPYLDAEMIRFAYALPRAYKFEGAWFRFHAVQEKRILRAVAARYLPEATRLRKKRGFSIPVPELLRSDLDKVRGYLMRNGSVARRLYTARDIERLLAFRPSFYSPLEKDKEFMVWKLFLLEVWSDHYLRGPRPAGGAC